MNPLNGIHVVVHVDRIRTISRIYYSHSEGTDMKRRQGPVVTARKRPQQERSTRLVADILEAAVRVLEREGAPRFTAARVAEAAGVSVGSLYQYFPNKEAMLFRLQTEEWEETWSVLEEILSASSCSP